METYLLFASLCLIRLAIRTIVNEYRLR
jgi:hypothetical protein